VERVYEAVDSPDDVRQEADGRWVIRAGARVRVRLTMVAPGRRAHVALVDALPAGQAKLAANWLMGEVSATLNREEKDIAQCPVTAPMLAALLKRILDNTVSNKIARDVFAAMWAGEENGQPDAIIAAKGLTQINDSGAIEAMIDAVLAEQAAIVAEYRAGKQKAFNSLVGQIMKAAKGKANPQQVNDLLKAKLDQT
jgi:aspartyl-tRNA(Asn)/glutamyl-tRNA(Gln) amidotransferase subunit B